MTRNEQPTPPSNQGLRIVRHIDVCSRLQVSSGKLFDMIAKGQFPKPFVIVPDGRAVGWLESDVDAWILSRSARVQEVAQ